MTYQPRKKNGQFQSWEQYDRNIKTVATIVITTLICYTAIVFNFGVSPRITVEQVHAQEVEEEPALPTPLEVALETIPHETEETARRITYLYEQAGEYADVLAKIAWCESMWFNVQSQVQQDYGTELSFGIFQLSVIHHDITVEQALDPYFSIDYAIELYKKEGEKPWYGYRNGHCTNGLPEYWL
jgi:hypothetical protein